MNCTNCKLPLPDGPPQTCPRCFTVNHPEQPKREQEKPRKRFSRRSRKGRRAPESPPASEPGTDIEQE